MLSRIKQSAFLILSLTVFATFASTAANPRPDDTMPSLQIIKAVDYVRATDDKLTDAMGYSALRDFINASQAYSSGLDVLPNFHEPVATRGETGISVFRKVSPSVVLVMTAKFKDDKVTDSALGTGVIVDPAGYVLTNWHVIHGYDAGIIFFKPAVGTEPPDNSSYGVELVASDETSDLALLKIIKPPSGLPAVKLGDLSTIQVAEDIHIIGHPHGKLWSYSSGVISQIRDQYDWQYEDGSKHFARVLQMQTAINPGNSGGPVLDNNSNMLGLVAMSEEGQNLNYAVAIDVVKKFVNSSLVNRTRGGVKHVQTEKGSNFVGHTKDGLSITKVVYSDLISYTVLDAKGAPTELFAENADGGILTGSMPNAFGGFADWTYKPLHGRIIIVKSSGIAPDIISAGKSD